MLKHFAPDPRTGRLRRTGYYYTSAWWVRAPRTGRERKTMTLGFYRGSRAGGLECGEACGFALRLADAGRVPGYRGIHGYYVDCDEGGGTIRPIIARLPRSRGFLAGYRADGNAGNYFSLDYGTTHETVEDAGRAAHYLAEWHAEECRADAERFRAELDNENDAE